MSLSKFIEEETINAEYLELLLAGEVAPADCDAEGFTFRMPNVLMYSDEAEAILRKYTVEHTDVVFTKGDNVLSVYINPCYHTESPLVKRCLSGIVKRRQTEFLFMKKLPEILQRYVTVGLKYDDFTFGEGQFQLDYTRADPYRTYYLTVRTEIFTYCHKYLSVFNDFRIQCKADTGTISLKPIAFGRDTIKFICFKVKS